MIKYKIDVFKELKEKGYNQTRIQKDNLISRQTITNIKAGKPCNMATLNAICVMLRCQPGDVIEFEITDDEKIKFF